MRQSLKSQLILPTLGNFPTPKWPFPETGREDSKIFQEGICWICDQKATLTREHILKKSLFKKVKEKHPDMHMEISGRPKPQKIQSADSKFVKSNPVICPECNNARTQKSDQLFDVLAWRARHSIFFTHPEMGFTMFRSQTEVNLFELYAVKVMGCVMASNEVPIPTRFADAIMKEDSRLANITYALGASAGARISNRGLPHSARTEAGMFCIFLKHPKKNKLGGYEIGVTIDDFTFHIFTQFYGREIDVLNQNIPQGTLKAMKRRPIKKWQSTPTFLVNAVDDGGLKRFTIFHPNGQAESIVQRPPGYWQT